MAVCELCGREINVVDGCVETPVETIDAVLDGTPEISAEAPEDFEVQSVEVLDPPAEIAPLVEEDSADAAPGFCPRCHQPLASENRDQEAVVAEITVEGQALTDEDAAEQE